MEMSAANMIAQVESLPALIQGEFDELDAQVRRLLNHNEYLSVKRVLLTGPVSYTHLDVYKRQETDTPTTSGLRGNI